METHRIYLLPGCPRFFGACGYQEAGFYGNILQPTFQQFRKKTAQLTSFFKSQLQPILNLALRPFHDIRMGIFKFTYVHHVYYIYIYISYIYILSHPMKWLVDLVPTLTSPFSLWIQGR